MGDKTLSLLSTVNTGFDNDIKTPKTPRTHIKHNYKLEESIKNTVNTGFGSENTLYVNCQSPKLVQHLAKENYLSEFETDTEKQLVRNNLGIYSKKEVDTIINTMVDINATFITKKEVEMMLANLDFVDSTLKSRIDYQIPETLFKL